MKKPAWYNWVGDAYWDGYCAVVWLFIVLPGLLFFGGLFIGIWTGVIKVVE